MIIHTGCERHEHFHHARVPYLEVPCAQSMSCYQRGALLHGGGDMRFIRRVVRHVRGVVSSSGG